MKYSIKLPIIYCVAMLGVLSSGGMRGEGLPLLPMIVGFLGGDILYALHGIIVFALFPIDADSSYWNSELFKTIINFTGISSLFLGGIIQYGVIGWLTDRVVKKNELKDEPLCEMPEDLRDSK